jgi:hypothetical protein
MIDTETATSTTPLLTPSPHIPLDVSMDTDNFDNEIGNTDQSFLSAVQPKVVNGITLQPFSAMRQAVALALGMQGAASTFFFDSVIMSYVCTLGEHEVIKLLADKDAAKIAAFHWADKQRFSIYNFKPVGDLYMTITAEIAKSVNARDDDEGQLEGNDGEPPSPSN